MKKGKGILLFAWFAIGIISIIGGFVWERQILVGYGLGFLVATIVVTIEYE